MPDLRMPDLHYASGGAIVDDGRADGAGAQKHAAQLRRGSWAGRTRLVLAWLPAWIAFMAYLPALANGFVWDDVYFLTDLPYLRSPELWPQHVLAPLFVSQNYFRPLPLLEFVVEGRLSGVNPFVFHLTNLLLHAANTAMLGALARRLLGGAARPGRGPAARADWIAAGAALVYGLHPALVESVAWISDRFDLMMTAFLLLALCCDAAIRNSRLAAAAVGSCFLLGLLCKETAVLLLVVLPLWHLALQGGMSQDKTRQGGARAKMAEWLTSRRVMMYGAVAAALVQYLLLRRAALGTLYHADTEMAPGSALQHLLLMGKTVGWYALLALWPFGLVAPAHPGRTPVSLDDTLAWLGSAVTVAALFGAFVLVRRAPRVGWLALALFAALAPVSNLVPLTIADNVVHDRFLLFPLCMAVLTAAAALGYWLESVPPARAVPTRGLALPWGLALPVAWLAAALASVLLILPHWNSDLSLWSWAYAKAPDSRIAMGNYMTAQANAGHNAEVIEIGKLILARYPDDAGALHNIALALRNQGKDDQALEYVTRALGQIDADDPKHRLDLAESLNLKGYILMHQKRWDEAERALRAAVAATPHLARPHFNLAMVAYERRDLATARAEMAVAESDDAPPMAALHRRLAAEKERELGY
jgi:hypothetical protein